MEYKICLSTGKRPVPAIREMSRCWPCPVWFYRCIVFFLFRCIELVLNHSLRLCHFLQQGFSLSKNSVPFLYLPPVISLVHQRVMDMTPVAWLLGKYASGLCHCAGADERWDTKIWPTIVLFLSAWCTTYSACWRGRPAPPCCMAQRAPQGLGQTLTSLVHLGSLGWVSWIAATQQPSQMMSHHCLSGPLPWSSSGCFLGSKSRPALTDFSKRSQISAFVQNSVWNNSWVSFKSLQTEGSMHQLSSQDLFRNKLLLSLLSVRGGKENQSLI